VSAARVLESIWWRREEPWTTRAALAPLSLLSFGYSAGAALARAAARPLRAGAPVVSVGNLCAGGAGKTPVALYLCERLLARGLRPALLSRGYGGRAREGTVVCDGKGPLVHAREAGDEPVLIALRCPRLLVLKGRQRALLAAEAVRRGADVLVLDDGLQHHALARDLDVIVVDATNPLGNGHLLPRGPLRERPAALRRVGPRGLLWLSNARDRGPEPELDGLLAEALGFGLRGPVESALEARAPGLRGAAVFLLAGIARPERFAGHARALGARVVGQAFFADHHPFGPADLASVRARAAAAGAERIVTTEKDLVRIHGSLEPGTLEGMPIEALPVDLRVLRGGDALEAALDFALARPPAGAPA
jgi:tetraacyldisaccharide 4'-kinase